MTPDPPIHPIAAIFPMLPDDDLQQLAEDIRQHGLLHPIALDLDGRVLDGRNRLAACRLAGVEPTYVLADTDDPLHYILSENVNRRHMTKSALAMAVVQARAANAPEVHLHTNGRALAGLVGVNEHTLSRAQVVYDYASDLIPQVIDGGSLNEALGIAQARKSQEEEDDKTLRTLRRKYPDLHQRVRVGTLSLRAAVEIATLLDEQTRLAKQIAAKHAEVQLAEEQVERSLGVTLDEALAMVPGASYAHRVLSPEEVAQQLPGAIDVAMIDRDQRALHALEVRDHLLRIVNGTDPSALSAEVGVEQLPTLVHTLEVVLRWTVEAYKIGDELARRGRLEAVK